MQRLLYTDPNCSRTVIDTYPAQMTWQEQPGPIQCSLILAHSRSS